MKNLLIGSRALAHWEPSLKLKPTADWDVITDLNISGVEIHDPYTTLNYVMAQYATLQVVDFNGIPLQVVSPIGLAIIKRSHLHREFNFDKHIAQYHFHLVQYRRFFTADDEVILKNRTEATKREFFVQHPRLNVAVPEFFDDAVPKVYEHDYLHELMAYQDKPLYTRLQEDSSRAWCSRDLWDGLTHEERVLCVAEEVQVIALERFLIPRDWNYVPRAAYIKALHKVCTTLTSGYFRDFAIDNYPEVMLKFDRQRLIDVRSELKQS